MRKKEFIPPTLETGKIYSLNAQGEGVGQLEKGEALIPFALPGEKVSFHRHIYKKKKKDVLLEVLEASSHRIRPVCAHFTQCGGCMLQHMDQTLYRDFKKSLITEPLIQHGLDPFIVEDILILPFGRRRRANLEAVKKNDQVFLGFHRWRSHQIIDIQECHTMMPELVKILMPLREALNSILSNFQKVKLFFTYTPQGIDISLEIQGVLSLTDEQKVILENFSKHNNIVRFIFKHGKKIDGIYQKTVPTVSFDGVDVTIDAYSFLQATPEADQALTDLVIKNIPASVTKIADLFCGRGTFSFPLSKLAPVDGYEFDKRALEALGEAVIKSGRPINVLQRNLYDHPLTSLELKTYDTVVIDPPRAGALEQIKELCQSTTVQTIIYVSCGPDTFARDAKTLTDSGKFNLLKITPIDQFAWSPHLEVVGIFTRK